MVETIQVRYDGCEIGDCVSAIVVPEMAMTEPGYIKTLTANAQAHAKHEFHTMAQVCHFSYQDDELDLVRASGPIEVEVAGKIEELVSGMVIYRDSSGEFHVLIHGLLNVKKMLESTNRYCTRWVRLDI